MSTRFVLGALAGLVMAGLGIPILAGIITIVCLNIALRR